MDKRLIVGLVTIAVFLVGCDTVDPDTPATETGELVLEDVETDEETFDVFRLVDELEHPWGVDWLPDGRMVVTERPGRLNLVDLEEEIVTLEGLPEIEATGQGGLLDVEVHPDYDDNGWIYFAYSAPEGGETGTAVARARISDDEEELEDVEQLWEQEPKYGSGRHYGSRISFVDDGTFVFTIGDYGERTPSQDLQDPTGSTIRLEADGSIPEDNPFVDDDEALDEIYTYGHRNAQGMDIHPQTGAIWQHEHGPEGGDELNLIEAGLNYGWPEATYGVEYAGGDEIGIDPDESDEFVDPITHWTLPDSIAPSGMAFVVGDEFPNWEGDIMLGALAHTQVRRVELDGEEVVHQEVMLDGDLGRIRAVEMGPDGLVYILTDAGEGGLYRLEP